VTGDEFFDLSDRSAPAGDGLLNVGGGSQDMESEAYVGLFGIKATRHVKWGDMFRGISSCSVMLQTQGLTCRPHEMFMHFHCP